MGGGWKCNNDDVQSSVCINVHCEKVERAPHCQSPLSYCTECSLVFCTKKRKEKKKMFEGGKYCILIVTWVLLREINKYELETCYGEVSKLFMSWDCFAQDVFEKLGGTKL